MKQENTSLIELSADSPIKERAHDKFDRFQFANRIATVIKNFRSSDAFVIGVYAKWGEGKSSVLEMVNTELNHSNSVKTRVETLFFNPWRYDSTDDLLQEFYQSLRSDVKLFEKILDKLHKNEKKIINIEEAVGTGLGVAEPTTALATKAVSKLLRSVIPTRTLIGLKSKVEKKLINSDKRLVVFIDDIDRLSPKEIANIFQLVKLTANLQNTIFVLAFDQETVASALNAHFSNSKSDESGKIFLEKIIQLPLSLPPFSLSQIRNYTLRGISKIIDENNIKLGVVESERLSRGLLNLERFFKSPRIAQQIWNNLLFTAPGLAGEVNFVDLILLEIIRTVRPEIHTFIFKNRSFFLNESSEVLEKREPEKELQRLIQSEELTDRNDEIELVRNLLFPASFDSAYVMHQEISTWAITRRVCHRNYFERYFKYFISPNDVSDIKFDNLIESEFDRDVFKELFKTNPSQTLQKTLDKSPSFDHHTSYDMVAAIFDGVTDLKINFDFQSDLLLSVDVILKLCARFPSEQSYDHSSLFSETSELSPQQAYVLASILRRAYCEKEERNSTEFFLSDSDAKVLSETQIPKFTCAFDRFGGQSWVPSFLHFFELTDPAGLRIWLDEKAKNTKATLEILKGVGGHFVKDGSPSGLTESGYSFVSRNSEIEILAEKIRSSEFAPESLFKIHYDFDSNECTQSIEQFVAHQFLWFHENAEDLTH